MMRVAGTELNVLCCVTVCQSRKVTARSEQEADMRAAKAQVEATDEAARRWMMMPSLDRVAASYCTLTQLKPRNRGMLCSPWSDAV
jgi:hypothetical protein